MYIFRTRSCNIKPSQKNQQKTQILVNPLFSHHQGRTGAWRKWAAGWPSPAPWAWSWWWRGAWPRRHRAAPPACPAYDGRACRCDFAWDRPRWSGGRGGRRPAPAAAGLARCWPRACGFVLVRRSSASASSACPFAGSGSSFGGRAAAPPSGTRRHRSCSGGTLQREGGVRGAAGRAPKSGGGEWSGDVKAMKLQFRFFSFRTEDLRLERNVVGAINQWEWKHTNQLKMKQTFATKS